MVKKVNNPITHKLPRIRINAKELLKFLEGFESKGLEVKATNGEYEFSGVADIKDNILIFCGFPNIYIDNIKIYTSSNSTNIYLYNYKDKHYLESEISAINEFMSKFKDPISNFFRISFFSFIFALFLFPIFRYILRNGNEENLIGVDLLYSIYYIFSITYIIAFGIYIFINDKRTAVFYNPKEKFLQKYGKLFFAAIIGGFVTLMFKIIYDILMRLN